MGDTNYLGTPVPPEIKLKIISSLKTNNMMSNTNFPKMTSAVIGMVVVAAFGFGYFSNTIVNKNKSSDMITESKSKFMLILKNTPEFKEDLTHAAEYGQWLSDLVAQGVVASGDELDISGTMLGDNQSTPSDLNAISGYFMIETNSEAKAKEIANACPHLKYGGQVMVKKVIQH